MYVAGKWREGKAVIKVFNPYDGSVVDTVPSADKEDVELAIQSAQRGAEIFQEMPYFRRSELIEKTADLLEQRLEEVAVTVTRENGKTINESRQELRRSVMTLRCAAEESQRIYGETLPLSAINVPNIENKFGFFFRVPCGVVLAITPFNAPVIQACHKAASALAAGNSIILKPASDTPLSTLKLVEIFLDAGLPEESINCLTGSGSELGEWLCTDKRIRAITFTGSYDVGNRICRLAGLKKLTMELGGNCPVIVMPDAEAEQVANALVPAGYGLAGQACISVQRVFVHSSLYEDVLNLSTQRLSAFILGDPMDEKTTMGPLIRESAAIRVENTINQAGVSGARILCGGKRENNFITPAIVADVKPDMKIYRQELFGPAVGFLPFETFDEAVAGANDTPYGLSAGIFTNDINTAMQFIRKVKTGNIMVNSPSRWRVDHMPSGGLKDSGLGKEGPRYAIEELTEGRTAIFHLRDRSFF